MTTHQDAEAWGLDRLNVEDSKTVVHGYMKCHPLDPWRPSGFKPQWLSRSVAKT